MPVKIFCCYAHEDEAFLNKLKSHLKPLQRQGLIEIWNDRDISAGTDIEKEISLQLNSAQIILLLISSDFMASDYCYGIEMQRAIERHNRGEARVIPIILRPVYRQGTPFSVLQVLPLNGKPIIERSSRHGREKAFLEVTIGIKEACDEIEKRGSNNSLSVNEIWDGKDTTPYRQTVQLDTIMALVMIHKAVTLFELKRYEEALMNYSIALSYDDQCARTYFPFCDLGEAYYNLKQYLLALKAYKEALDLDSEDVDAHVGFGNTLFKLKHNREAFVAYVHALHLEPYNIDAKVGTNNVFNEFSPFEINKRNISLAYERVLEAYKEALDLDPENIVAQIGRANTLFKLRRYQEAFVVLLDYSSYKRFSYETFSRKGVFYVPSKLPESKEFLYLAFEKVLFAYEEILSLDPSDGDAHEGKGNTLQYLGRESEADLAYMRVHLRHYKM